MQTPIVDDASPLSTAIRTYANLSVSSSYPPPSFSAVRSQPHSCTSLKHLPPPSHLPHLHQPYCNCNILRPAIQGHGGRRGRVTKQSKVCFPMYISRLEQKCFSWRQKVFVDRNSISSVLCSVLAASSMLAVWRQRKPRCRRDRGTTRSPH